MSSCTHTCTSIQRSLSSPTRGRLSFFTHTGKKEKGLIEKLKLRTLTAPHCHSPTVNTHLRRNQRGHVFSSIARRENRGCTTSHGLRGAQEKEARSETLKLLETSRLINCTRSINIRGGKLRSPYLSGLNFYFPAKLEVMDLLKWWTVFFVFLNG